jgi:hypothetical protein
MTRRTLIGLLVGSALADDRVRLTVGGAPIDVSFEGSAFDLGQPELVRWVKRAAEAVTAYFGRYPVPSARIRVTVDAKGEEVSEGKSSGDKGVLCKISLGRHATRQDLDQDWILTHEMVHFGFPSVERRHHWIEEGSATYVEPIARVRSGQLSAEAMWRDVVRDMHQGLPESGDKGLDHTHTWGRTYWGGALFCLLADVGIRRATSNRRGLEHALRAINQAGGTIEADWPLERALATGGEGTGTKVLADLYEQMRAQPYPVDLPKLWADLGVKPGNGAVTFDDRAPLAAVRLGIEGERA